PALSRGDGRPLRALPPTPGQGCAGAAQLPEPALLLGLVRRSLRTLLRARHLAGRDVETACPRPRPLADGRPRRARAPRRAGVARRPRPAAAAAAGHRRGRPRRPHRGAARPRRRGAARRRDESLRPPLRAAVTPHLALAAAAAREPGVGASG